MINKNLLRKFKGSAIVTLMIFFMVFVVMTLGLLGYEFARYQLCLAQLKSLCDAASLAGSLELSSITSAGLAYASNPNNNPSGSPTWAPNPAYPPPGASSNQWYAMQAAAIMFTLNQGSNSVQSILGNATSLITTFNYDTAQVSLSPPGPNKCNLAIGWIDTQTDQPTSNMSDPNAKIMTVNATYGYQPAFFNLLHLPASFNLPLSIGSRAGGNMIDLALCFDLSGSMDDQTPMILVQRSVNNNYVDVVNGTFPSAAYVPGNDNLSIYTVPQTTSGIIGYNTVYNLQSNGSPLGAVAGALYPKALAYYGYGTNPATGAQIPFDYLSNYYWSIPQGGFCQQQKPPIYLASNPSPPYENFNQNYTPSMSIYNTQGYYMWSNRHPFTDAIVDILVQQTPTAGLNTPPTYPPADFTTAYPGTFMGQQNISNTQVSYNGSIYNFPDIPTVVEAARGNLESTTFARNAGLNISNSSIKPYFTPKAGYYDAYMQAALSNRLPIFTAQSEAAVFLGQMQSNANVHFAFIPFAGNAYSNVQYTSDYGTDPYNDYITDPDPNCFPSPPNKGWVKPGVQFNTTPGTNGSNYSKIMSYFYPIQLLGTSSAESGYLGGDPAYTNSMMADGGTCIAGGLATALSEFGSGGNSRVSQGATGAVVLFTDGEPDACGDAGTNDPTSQFWATQLGKKGIKLYCVGLAQNPTVYSQQQGILNGLVSVNGLSGSHAYFIPPGSAQSQRQALNQAFASISMSLVGLSQ